MNVIHTWREDGMEEGIFIFNTNHLYHHLSPLPTPHPQLSSPQGLNFYTHSAVFPVS